MALLLQSTVLEEVIDPEYVPTEKDIAEYAAFLGLDMEAEPELAWIANKGLVTPLPEGWKPCAAPSGELCALTDSLLLFVTA